MTRRWGVGGRQVGRWEVGRWGVGVRQVGRRQVGRWGVGKWGVGGLAGGALELTGWRDGGTTVRVALPVCVVPPLVSCNAGVFKRPGHQPRAGGFLSAATVHGSGAESITRAPVCCFRDGGDVQRAGTPRLPAAYRLSPSGPAARTHTLYYHAQYGTPAPGWPGFGAGQTAGALSTNPRDPHIPRQALVATYGADAVRLYFMKEIVFG